MTLWFGIVLMTAVAVAAVLWPLRRRGVTARSGSRFDVFRIQLADIAQDRAAGLISKDDANAAVVEASRRLLAADSELVPGDALAGADWRRRMVAAAIPVLLPLGTGGLYVAFGSPGLPARPLAARLDAGLHAPIARRGEPIDQIASPSIGGAVVSGIDLAARRLEDAVVLVPNPYANGAAPLEAGAGFAGGLAAFDASDPGTRFLVELDHRSDQRAAIWSNILGSPPSEATFGMWIGKALSPVSASRMVDVEASHPGRSSMGGAVDGATDQQ